MRAYLRLLSYAKPHGRSWLLVLILTTLGALFTALQPWPMKIVVDHVLGHSPMPPVLLRLLELAPGQWDENALLILAVASGLILFILSSAADALLAIRWTLTGRTMVYRLAQDLLARLQKRSLSFHKNSTVADLMGRITTDSWSVYQVIEVLFFTPFHALLTTAAMVWLMFELDTRLTLVTLCVAPLMVASSFLLGKPLRAAAKLKREIESQIQAHIQQTLTGIPVVQAFGQESRASSRFNSYAGQAIRSQQRGALLGSVNSLTSGFIAAAGTGLVLWLGARDVLAGSLTLGSLLVFLVYLSSLQAQVKTFAGLYTSLQNLSASSNRAVEILNTPIEIADAPSPVHPGTLKGSVQFRNVSTCYEPGRPVLEQLSLAVSPGETIAIVGPTGAGKTTLVSLVPRFLDASGGSVLVDGQDVRHLALKDLRSQIGVVLQESFLFPFSIRDNIAYGAQHASPDQVRAAAQAAHADEFIRELPQGYDTIIGERGATLSGGQRQRLAIARALLRNPPILILDEPTSALDPETEHTVMAALNRLMQGRTTFVIAHRLSTIRSADRIAVLEKGRMVETGTYPDLLAKGGAFARLHMASLQRQTISPEVTR